MGLEIDESKGVCDIYKEEQHKFPSFGPDIPGTLAKGLAGAHFGEKDQIALRNKAVE